MVGLCKVNSVNDFYDMFMSNILTVLGEVCGLWKS